MGLQGAVNGERGRCESRVGGQRVGVIGGGRRRKLFDVNHAVGGHIYLSTNFFRAPSAYRIFCALKHHVGCHRYDNFGRRFATLEASINGESKCCSTGRRIQESRTVSFGGGAWMGGQEAILKMKVAVKNNMCIFFWHNCNWFVNLILLFTSFIKILVCLKRLLLDSILVLLMYFLLIDS